LVRAPRPADEPARLAALHDAQVDAHRGTVRLESEPGIGTTVDLNLPGA
jgi:hypothetical protein